MKIKNKLKKLAIVVMVFIAAIMVSPSYSNGSESAIDSFETEISNENELWTTKEENGKVGFGYTENGEWKWAIKPKFDPVAAGAQFKPKQLYADVIISGNQMLDPKSCGVRAHQFVTAVINRQGDIILKGKTGESFKLIPNSSYAIQMIGAQGDGSKGCEAHIINVANGKSVYQLKANYQNTGIQHNYINIYGNEGAKWYYHFDTRIVQGKTPFYSSLNQEFKSKKFNTFLIYAHKTNSFGDKVTGFLFGYEDNFKVVESEWVKTSN